MIYRLTMLSRFVSIFWIFPLSSLWFHRFTKPNGTVSNSSNILPLHLLLRCLPKLNTLCDVDQCLGRRIRKRKIGSDAALEVGTISMYESSESVKSQFINKNHESWRLTVFIVNGVILLDLVVDFRELLDIPNQLFENGHIFSKTVFVPLKIDEWVAYLYLSVPIWERDFPQNARLSEVC